MEKCFYLKDVVEEFKKVKEFQIQSTKIKGQVKSFKKVSNHQYEALIEREKGAYELYA